jgi:hypothetical protein
LHINRFSNDKGCSKHTALFVLPDGFAIADGFVTADDLPSIKDQKMCLMMRSMVLVDKAILKWWE